MAEFYIQMFGAEKREVRQESEARTVVELVLDGIRILILTPWDADSDNYGLDHFGLVTDDLDAAITGVKSKGVKFVMEKTSLPVADISFLKAPDNAIVEVIETKSL